MRTQSITIKCPHCAKLLGVNRNYFGRQERCPKCGESITVNRNLVVNRKNDDYMAEDEVLLEAGNLLQVNRHHGIGIVRFLTSRILDQTNVQELGDALENLYKKYELRKIVLNFDGVDYMSSAVIGQLIQLYKQLSSSGGQLYLCNISPNIFDIFEIMHLDELFDIAGNEDEAVMNLMV